MNRKDPKRRRTAYLLLAYPGIFLVLVTILMPFFFSREAYAAQVTLAWNRNSEPTVAGYKVYYGTASRAYSAVIDVGNWTSCVISGLQNGITYFFTATAYDSAGNESDFAAEVSYTVPTGASPSPDPSSTTETSPATATPGGGSGGCFIATAAYGSYMAPEVMVLRRFRDDFLLTNAPGRFIVGLYYRLSPPVADVIREREYLKSLIRWVLTPVVCGIKHPSASALFATVLLVAAGLIARIGRNRSPRKTRQANPA